MAIAASKLGKFVAQEGFSWPTSESASPEDYSASDDRLVRRLRETGLVRADVSDGAVAETFQAARREHAGGGYSPFNSPHERVRVFLSPFLSEKGRRWAVPLDSMTLRDDEDTPHEERELFAHFGLTFPNDEEGRSGARSWWKFWKR